MSCLVLSSVRGRHLLSFGCLVTACQAPEGRNHEGCCGRRPFGLVRLGWVCQYKEDAAKVQYQCTTAI